jgi:hypothetical protein
VTASLKEVDLQSLVKDIDGSIAILHDRIIKLTAENARKILVDAEFGAEVVDAFMKLQEIHGIILCMHPDSIYSGTDFKEKPNTIFNDLIALSKANSDLIDIAFDVLQHLQSPDVSGIMANDEYCYNLFKNKIDESVSWSFCGLVLRILSNCRKIVSYLSNIKPLEREKGDIAEQRNVGVGASTSFRKVVDRMLEPTKEESAESHTT